MDQLGGIPDIGSVQEALSPEVFSGASVGNVAANAQLNTNLGSGSFANFVRFGDLVDAPVLRAAADQIRNAPNIQNDVRSAVNRVRQAGLPIANLFQTASESMYAALDPYEKARWKTGMALTDHTISMHRMAPDSFSGQGNDNNKLFSPAITQIKNLNSLSEYAAKYHNAMVGALTKSIVFKK